MAREFEVSRSIDISVDPATAYSAVSDVRQMGRWSPENLGAVIQEEFKEAHVGMRFVGDNKRGPMKWKTECVVTAADAGRRFAFDVVKYGFGQTLIPIKIATWTYDFEAIDGGTRVTETWQDGRTSWPNFAVRLFDPVATRRRSFAEFQKWNVEQTLANLKRELESAKV